LNEKSDLTTDSAAPNDEVDMPCWIGYSAIPLRRLRKPIAMRGEIHLKCGACMGGEADRMPLGEVVAGGPWMRIDPLPVLAVPLCATLAGRIGITSAFADDRALDRHQAVQWRGSCANFGILHGTALGRGRLRRSHVDRHRS
jgi:hypothetical protein